MKKQPSTGLEAPGKKKQVRFYLVLPLLVIPFLTMGFWAMGGGKGKSKEKGIVAEGFNKELPSAVLKQQQMDKMSFYEMARQDSLRLSESAKRDPYFSALADTGDFSEEPGYPEEGFSGLQYREYEDPNEQKVMERLSKLNQVLEQGRNQDYSTRGYAADQDVAGLKEDIARLENMMQMMKHQPQEADPEMTEINNVLSTVLDIQHPERVRERLREESLENLGQIYSVAPAEYKTPVTLIDNRSVSDYAADFQANPDKAHNSFFGLDEKPLAEDIPPHAIEAVIHETQTLTSGSTVKMRLAHDIFINGVFIPKDNFVYGTASLRGERLEVEIENIRFGASLFPVKLSVHDMDGLAGIHIPGAISRDVAKQSGDQTVQSLSLGSFNPSLGAQAASAGIELGKNLISKKIKLIKVEVKAGHRLLLRDNKKRDY